MFESPDGICDETKYELSIKIYVRVLLESEKVQLVLIQQR